jgi:hypothetical protein
MEEKRLGAASHGTIIGPARRKPSIGHQHHEGVAGAVPVAASRLDQPLDLISEA